MKEYKALKKGEMCKACHYWHGAKKQVLGEQVGIKAKIMIIGEAPGADEEKYGKPFIGQSGKILRRLLSDILPYSYITNIVKCRPPKNETPKKGNAETCVSLNLVPQVAEHYPPVILLVGKTARDYFPYEIYAGKIFSIMHPAATLYKPSLKDKYEENVAKVVKEIKAFL